MLSGTASWLTLALFEALGVNDTADGFTAAPVLPADAPDYRYTMQKNGTTLYVQLNAENSFRASAATTAVLDGHEVKMPFALPTDGAEHTLRVVL